MLKQEIILLLALSLTSLQLSAAPPENRFFVNGVYLFNVVARTDATELDFNEDNGFAGFAGYRFNSHFGIELGGINFDPVTSTVATESYVWNTEYQVTGYSLGFRAEAPVGKLFTAWLGVGLFSWDSTFNYDIEYPAFAGTTVTGSNTNSGEDIYLRAGVSHPLFKNFNFTLEATQYQLNDFFSGTTDNNTDFQQDFIGIGIEYNF